MPGKRPLSQRTSEYMPKIRTFIAVDTPPDVKYQIGMVRDQLKSAGADVRWEPNEKLHCTLKFLGASDSVLLEKIIVALEREAGRTPPLSIRYRSIGCFPTIKDPRVVWIGMEEGGSGLASLQQRIEECLAPFGFPREERAFHPHVTLGRVKGRHNIVNLLRMIESVTFESEPVTLREVLLVKSDLRPAGSVYTTLKSLPLTA